MSGLRDAAEAVVDALDAEAAFPRRDPYPALRLWAEMLRDAIADVERVAELAAIIHARNDHQLDKPCYGCTAMAEHLLAMGYRRDPAPPALDPWEPYVPAGGISAANPRIGIQPSEYPLWCRTCHRPKDDPAPPARTFGELTDEEVRRAVEDEWPGDPAPYEAQA